MPSKTMKLVIRKERGHTAVSATKASFGNMGARENKCNKCKYQQDVRFKDWYYMYMYQTEAYTLYFNLKKIIILLSF